MKQQLWSAVLIVLVTLMLCRSQAEKALSVEETTTVIAGLQQYFRSGCVFFLYSNVRTDYELRHEAMLFRLNKKMSYSGGTCAAINVGREEASLEHLRCQKNRPVNVLTSDDQAVRLSLMKMAVHRDFARSIWLLLMNAETGMEKFFTDIDVPVDSELLVAHRQENDVRLTEVYRVRGGYPLQVHAFGTVSGRDNALSSTNINFYSRRNNLQGLIMQAATTEDTPYVRVEKNPNGSTTVTGGMFGNVWKVLEGKLNFSTNFTYVEQVIINKTDYFEKMVNDVKAGKYDIAVAAFRCVHERALKVDYTYLLHTSKFEIALKPAANEDMAWSHFLGPFQPSLWFGLIACILVIAGCLSVFHYAGQRLAYLEYELPKQYTFSVSIFYVFSMFCQQGHEVTPRSCACRMVYWLGYVTAVVVMAAYSATLISFLTIQNKEPPFKTLEALVADRSYEMGLLRQYVRIIRHDTDHGITDDIYERMIAPDPKNIVNTSLEGVQRVCDSKYAFWTSIEAVKQVGDAVDCSIAFLKYRYSLNLAMILTSGSPYRSLINYQLSDIARHNFRNDDYMISLFHRISMLQSVGVLRKHKLDSWPALVPIAENTWTSVSVGQIKPLLTVLSGGMATSLALLLIEIAVRWWKKQSQRRNEWSGQLSKQLHTKHLFFRV